MHKYIYILWHQRRFNFYWHIKTMPYSRYFLCFCFLIPLLMLKIQFELLPCLLVHSSFLKCLLLLQEIQVTLQLCPCRDTDFCHFLFKLTGCLLVPNFALIDVKFFFRIITWLTASPKSFYYTLCV